MSEWLNVVAAAIGLIVVVVPVIAGIRTRDPAKRRYWEREVQERLGPDKNWPFDSRLRKRAEIALAYLDADEAIRRTGVPDPAASWAVGAFGYIIAVICGVAAGQLTDGREQLTDKVAQATSTLEAETAKAELADVASPLPLVIIGLIFLVIAVWGFLDAAGKPQKRQELQRVLVSLAALPGGVEALLERPESLVKKWNDRKYRSQAKQTTKDVNDTGRCYVLWAAALLRTYEAPGPHSASKPNRKRILRRN